MPSGGARKWYMFPRWPRLCPALVCITRVRQKKTGQAREMKVVFRFLTFSKLDGRARHGSKGTGPLGCSRGGHLVRLGRFSRKIIHSSKRTLLRPGTTLV